MSTARNARQKSCARGPRKHYSNGKIIPYKSHALQLKRKLEKFASQHSQLDTSFCRIPERRYLVKREFERQVEKPQCFHREEGEKSVGFEAKCEYRSAVRNILEDCLSEMKRIRKEAAEGLQLRGDEGTNEAGGMLASGDAHFGMQLPDYSMAKYRKEHLLRLVIRCFHVSAIRDEEVNGMETA